MVETVVGACFVGGVLLLFILAYWVALTWAQTPGVNPVPAMITAILATWGPWSLVIAANARLGKVRTPNFATVALCAVATMFVFGGAFWMGLVWTSDNSAHTDFAFVAACLVCMSCFSTAALVRYRRNLF